MVDPILITTLATSGIALLTAVFTHIRYSSCYGFSCKTRSPSGTPTPTTPLINHAPRPPL